MDVRRLLELQEEVRFRVDPAEAGVRLDVALAGRMPWASRAKVARWVREGLARVDGTVERRPGHGLLAGQEVSAVVPKTPRDLHVAIDDLLAIEVVAEGPGWRVVEKPAGVPCHPSGGSIRRTVLTALAVAWEAEVEAGGPWPPHRLDRETSGLFVVALRKDAQTRFSDAFAAGRIRRFYRARVRGRLGRARERFTIDQPLVLTGRKPDRFAIGEGGVSARTIVTVLDASGATTDLEVEPVTGRQHQIRVHLMHLGHPIAGDPVYDPEAAFEPRMMLHARELHLPRDVAGTPEDLVVTSRSGW